VIGRRAFLATIAVLARSLAAEAQHAGKIWRIGYLRSTNSLVLRTEFLQGLHDLGYVEGRDFVVEYRFAEGRPDRFPELAADLVRAQVDVIVTSGTQATMAAKQATQTIPIVFASAGAVMAKGIVESLARPGGNATGLQIHVDWSKLFQLLKEAVPTITRVALLHDPATNPGEVLKAFLESMHSAAQAQNVALQAVAVSDPTGVAKAFAEFRSGTNGLLIEPAPPFVFKAEEIGRSGLRRRLAIAGYGRVFADAGCLMSYGENLGAMYRSAAVYVDKILKGAKAADLPVEQPTKFELVINLKTAKVLGLTIPPSLLLRADQVIE
jgi:putative ABC transport system substrate-binding protein